MGVLHMEEKIVDGRRVTVITKQTGTGKAGHCIDGVHPCTATDHDAIEVADVPTEKLPAHKAS